MKKVTRVIIVLFFMLTGVLFAETTNFKQNVVYAETTVYVTPTGSKYHTHACGRGNFYTSTLSSAQSRGLTPCSKCFGGGSNDGGSSGGSNDGKKKTVVKPIKINKKSLILLKGQTSKLKIRNATGKVKWKTSKKSVVTVSSKGKVVGKKAGKAVVTALVGKTKKICKIKVEEPKLNVRSLSMNIGDSKKIKLSGCSHSIKWSSSNGMVAKVKKGKVTAKDAGTTTITAKTHGKKYKCKIKVNPPIIKDFTLSSDSLKIGYDKETTAKGQRNILYRRA